jgi:hypothetical protein
MSICCAKKAASENILQGLLYSLPRLPGPLSISTAHRSQRVLRATQGEKEPRIEHGRYPEGSGSPESPRTWHATRLSRLSAERGYHLRQSTIVRALSAVDAEKAEENDHVPRRLFEVTLLQAPKGNLSKAMCCWDPSPTPK